MRSLHHSSLMRWWEQHICIHLSPSLGHSSSFAAICLWPKPEKSIWMIFNKAKCWVLLWALNYPMRQYRLSKEWLESCAAEQDPELKAPEQEQLAEGKPPVCTGGQEDQCALACIRSSIAAGLAVSLYVAPVKPHLECWAGLCAPHYRRTLSCSSASEEHWSWWRNRCPEEQLKELGMFSLEKRGLRRPHCTLQPPGRKMQQGKCQSLFLSGKW